MADAMLEAKSISSGICDFCPGVHINLHDADGNVFATALIAAAAVPQFIAGLQAMASEAALRIPAPVRRQ